MAIKHIITDGHGNAVDHPSIKSKAKKVPYVMAQSIQDYLLQRDRVLFKVCDEETKKALLIKYGKI